ncbi:MAG: hypothetical protein AAGE52_37545 [Myxococcota bacterium]
MIFVLEELDSPATGSVRNFSRVGYRWLLAGGDEGTPFACFLDGTR